MLYSIYLSFVKWNFTGDPKWIGLANYEKLATDKLIGQSLKVTLLYTLTSVPLGLCVAFLLATLLNQPVRGIPVFRTLFYMPSLVSGIANSVLWLWMFNPDFGVINTLLKMIGVDGPGWIYDKFWALPSLVIMSLWGVGGSMLIYLAGLQGIPTEYYEAAEIDGARSLGRFVYITLPMMTPVIFFNLVMGMIGAFQAFTEAYAMTNGGPSYSTLFFVYYLYQNTFKNFKIGYASAQAWLLFVIIVLFTMLIFRSSNAWVYYASDVAGGKRRRKEGAKG
jgi:multiple sugar transport system permease protein